MSTCPTCGSELRPDARFCRTCGTPVGEQPAEGSRFEPPTVPPAPAPSVPPAPAPSVPPTPPPPLLGPPPTSPPPPPPTPLTEAVPASHPEGGYWAAVGRAGDPPLDAPTRAQPAPPATPTTPQPALAPSPYDPRPRRSPLATVLLVLLAIAVVAGAGVGGYLAFSDKGSTDDPSRSSSDGGSATTGSLPSGGIRHLKPTNLQPSCVDGNGKDAAGRVTTYAPGLVFDDRVDTAWRCASGQRKQTLIMRFDHPVHLTSVGLVPGLVKIDPTDGTDRFAQNNKVRQVTWSFGRGNEGAGVVQTFAPTHDLQSTAVDVTTTTVELVVTEVTQGQDVTNKHGDSVAATGKTPIATVDLQGKPA